MVVCESLLREFTVPNHPLDASLFAVLLDCCIINHRQIAAPIQKFFPVCRPSLSPVQTFAPSICSPFILKSLFPPAPSHLPMYLWFIARGSKPLRRFFPSTSPKVSTARQLSPSIVSVSPKQVSMAGCRVPLYINH